MCVCVCAWFHNVSYQVSFPDSRKQSGYRTAHLPAAADYNTEQSGGKRWTAVVHNMAPRCLLTLLLPWLSAFLPGLDIAPALSLLPPQAAPGECIETPFADVPLSSLRRELEGGRKGR